MQWLNDKFERLAQERASLELGAHTLLEQAAKLQDEIDALTHLEEYADKARSGDVTALGAVAAMCQQMGLEWASQSTRDGIEVTIYPPQTVEVAHDGVGVTVSRGGGR